MHLNHTQIKPLCQKKHICTHAPTHKETHSRTHKLKTTSLHTHTLLTHIQSFDKDFFFFFTLNYKIKSWTLIAIKYLTIFRIIPRILYTFRNMSIMSKLFLLYYHTVIFQAKQLFCACLKSCVLYIGEIHSKSFIKA